MRIDRLMTVLLVAAACACLDAQDPEIRLQKLLGISAENGIVAVDHSTLSVFASGNLRIQEPATREWTFLSQKPATITIKVDGTRWQELPNPLPGAAAESFALCDPLNQIDQSSSAPQLRSVLRSGAKIKSVVFIDPELTVVVYSTSRDRVTYDVRVALVRGGLKRGYSLVDDDVATEVGTFCGVQQSTPGVLYVFADEVAGSSDSSVVYVYALTAKKR
jgi:hypothetical protein